jgi:probable HAF family extracellular repeat protein
VRDRRTHAYRFSHGVFTQVDFPGSQSSVARGISSSGTIVGSFTDARGVSHGYVWNDGVCTPFDFQGVGFVAVATAGGGINSEGDIVGKYTRPGNPKTGHGFLITGMH